MEFSQKGILALCLSALVVFSLFAVYASTQPAPDFGTGVTDETGTAPEDFDIPLDEAEPYLDETGTTDEAAGTEIPVTIE